VTLVAITGYASLDHVVMLDGRPAAGRTTMITDRPAEWPRLGGSPAFIAAALARGGVATMPLSWVGADPPGDAYCEKLAEAGVPADGIARLPGTRTPLAILAYEPDGGCICLYHTGMPPALPLSSAQLAIVGKADWVCLAIGPREATTGVLGAMRPDAKLAWVVKHAPTDMPFEHAVLVAERADLICCSRAEGEFVHEVLRKAKSRPGRILIETRGAEGASITRDGGTLFVPAIPVTATDPTGAGDTFAGGALAAIAKGESDLTKIVEAGHRAARALLLTRQTG
jgi:ribokinase